MSYLWGVFNDICVLIHTNRVASCAMAQKKLCLRFGDVGGVPTASSRDSVHDESIFRSVAPFSAHFDKN